MKNKMDRLERFKNRTEPGKKVTDSCDRDLSNGDVKWCMGLVYVCPGFGFSES